MYLLVVINLIFSNFIPFGNHKTKVTNLPSKKQIKLLKIQCKTNLFSAMQLLYMKQKIDRCLIGKKFKSQKIYLKALRYELLGNIDKSIEIIRKNLKYTKHFRVLKLKYAQLLLLKGKTLKPEGLFDEIYDDYDRNLLGQTPWELLSAGLAAEAKSKWADADEIYSNLTSSYPAFVPGLIATGNFYQRREIFSQSYGVLTKAINIAPFYVPALTAMSSFLFNHPTDRNLGKGFKYIRRALKLNPDYVPAYLEEIKVALFDLNLTKAGKILQKILNRNNQYSRIYTMKAAISLLSDDINEYQILEKKVASEYPSFFEFYLELGQLLNRHHRYDVAVKVVKQGMMRFPDNASLMLKYGTYLLRIGQDKKGFYFIKQANKIDPDNVPASNLTVLYEDKIFKDYIKIKQGHFIYHVHKSEWNILKPILPPIMEAAFERYQKHYAFTPKTPIILELFPKHDDFTVLIAGEPIETGIMGVCFGKVIDALSPSAGYSNWAMVLTHELAHVFHIQMTQNKVVRWFTEGLAEFETSFADYRWTRERFRQLYTAVSQNGIKGVAHINESFSHASSDLEMVNAYILSTWIIRYLYLQTGFAGLRKALKLYGRNKSTPEIIKEITGLTPKEFDENFKRYFTNVFSIYKNHFDPNKLKYFKIKQLKKNLEKTPSVENLAKYTLKLYLNGEKKSFDKYFQKLKKTLKNPYVLLIKILQMQRKYMKTRKPAYLKQTIKFAENFAKIYDGFFIRDYLAFLYKIMKNSERYILNLQKANRFDPDDVATIKKIVVYYLKTGNLKKQLKWFVEYARRNEGSASACYKISDLAWKLGDYNRVLEFGTQLIHIQPFKHPEYFLKMGKAAFYVNKPQLAIQPFALYFALGGKDTTGHIRYLYAKSLLSIGKKNEAKKILKEVLHLYPNLSTVKILLNKLHH